MLGSPQIRILPEKRSRPAMHLIMVDLPAPFGPSRTAVSPAFTEKLMSELATVLPYFLVTFSMRSSSSDIGWSSLTVLSWIIHYAFPQRNKFCVGTETFV